MENLNSAIKFGVQFTRKYAFEYYKAMLKPVLVAILAFLLVNIAQFGIWFALIALLSVPCICYSFWRGYVITYALNYLAFDFLKGGNEKLEHFIELTLKKEGELAKFVLFIAVISIFGYLPTILYFIKTVSFKSIIIDPYSAITSLAPVIIFSLLNTLILMPFINFSLQAFFFKRDENYFGLFFNCYSKLNLTGFLIAFIVVGINFVVSSIAPIIYAFAFLILNLFAYSINTAWYYSRLKR